MMASTFWKKTMPLCTGCDQSTAWSSSWWSAKLPAVWKNFFGWIGARSRTSPSFSRCPVSSTLPSRAKYSRVDGTSSSMTSSSSRRPTRPSSKVISFMVAPDLVGDGQMRRSGSDHVVATVGQHVGTGDVRGVLGGEEECGAGHDLGRRDLSERGLGDQFLASPALPVLALQGGAGLHEARGEGVHPHGRREGTGVRLGHPDQPVLRGGVLGRPRAATDHHGRADVDDVAVTLLHHPLAELVAHQ